MKFFGSNFLGWLVAAAIVAANPVVAGQIPTFEAEARRSAFEHPAVVSRYGGLYGDRDLNIYINEIGERLAAADDSDLKFHFTILDNSTATAFATPGGYIYISRIMLALANSEAEIAAVLAHEMVHVIERHAARRLEMENAQREEGTFPDAAAFQTLARDQEIEADAIGVRIIAAAGYDPMAQARFLQTISDFSKVLNQVGLVNRVSDKSDYFPTPDIRIVAAIEAAAEANISFQPWGAEGQNLGYDAIPAVVPVSGMIRREKFLSEIENIVYGPRPAEGLVVGNTFVDARSRFTFELPPGFRFTRVGRTILAEGPEGAALRFDLQYRFRRSNSDITQYMKYGAGRGLKFDTVEQIEISGKKAAVGTIDIPGPLNVYFVAVQFSHRAIFRFEFIVPDSFSETMMERIEASTTSLRLLTEREAQTWPPLKLKIVTVTEGMSIPSLAARMRLVDHPVDWLMLLNGLLPGSMLHPGQRIKILVQ